MQAPKSYLTAFFLALLILALPAAALAQTPEPPAVMTATDFCPALAPSTGNIVNVDTVAELVDAVNQAASGDVILIADGTYELNGAYLRIDVDNVTLRSASGNREAVVLDGNYDTTEIIQVIGSNITIADITLREAVNHPIHVTSTEAADTLNTLIYNVHIIDPGEQAIKINPYAQTGVLHFTDDGVIACSHIEMTDAGRSHVSGCYTGGVDAHQSENWVIRDNVIEGFWCDSGLSEHAIHMWNACRGTLVERNVLNDNARGVGFGMTTDATGKRTYPDNPCPDITGYVDHYEGIVRNNFIVANDSDLFASEYGFDCGVCLWQACEAEVYHNTIHTANPDATFSSIEWRFARTTATIINNIVNDAMRERDGASATQSGNLTNGQASWFVNAADNNLHLTATATDAIDQVTAPTGAPTDIDGDARPGGATSDVGADEYGVVAHDPDLTPTFKQVSTPYARFGDAVTFTVGVRNATGPIDVAALMTDTLPQGLQYVPGSLSAASGAVDDSNAPTLYWTGVLSPDADIDVTYSAVVTYTDPSSTTILPASLVNEAIVTAGDSAVMRSTTLMVNTIQVYLPLVLRQ